MNDDVLNIISKQVTLVQETISNILNTSAELLSEMSSQAINELSFFVQTTLQQLISICYEQIKDELSKTQAMVLQELSEAPWRKLFKLMTTRLILRRMPLIP